MNNFVFLSPNFPENYWQFCRELKNNGMNVLGIGDCPYENLSQQLKDSLTEYYYVRSLMEYNEVFRAVAFFTYKYGKIDWLESNNEFWLERDAALRKEFNITSGFMPEDMPKVKYKSKMKECYNKVGIKTAAYHLVDNLEGCKKFIKEYGYPVIVKPDNGVGANATYKLNNDKELEDFINSNPQTQYIMEEYLDAEVFSYDAVVNSKGEPIFETGNVTAVSIMDTVNNNGDSIFYLLGNPYKDVVEAGRKALKSFDVKSRFIHFEFFRLLKDQRLGKKGEVVALEVNMRPSGGISPDMMNYANSTNVYKNECVSIINNLYLLNNTEYDLEKISIALFESLCLEEYINNLDIDKLNKLLDLCNNLDNLYKNSFYGNIAKNKILEKKKN